jgi:glycopeptide antibiotics resistance protein
MDSEPPPCWHASRVDQLADFSRSTRRPKPWGCIPCAATSLVRSQDNWCGLVALLRRKKNVGLVYLILVTVFFLYVYKVLDYTLLRFQTLLLLKHFVPGLMLKGVPPGRSLNLIPLVALRSADVKGSLLNIVMMLPFGFGLPFIADLRCKQVVIAGLLFSVSIELVQLITGFASSTTFRIADVNDVIFNTIGVASGYALSVAFAATAFLTRPFA